LVNEKRVQGVIRTTGTLHEFFVPYEVIRNLGLLQGLVMQLSLKVKGVKAVDVNSYCL